MTTIDPYLEGGVLIDVRSTDEWDEEHLEEAILIPDYEIPNEIVNHVPNLDTPINLHCASGMRADAVKKKLLKMGYKKVSNLGGLASARRALMNHQKKN